MLNKTLLNAKRKWLARIATGLLMLSLTACATVTPDTVTICPEMAVFSKEQQKQIADDLEAVPPTSPVWLMASDWMSMRDQIRAGCR